MCSEVGGVRGIGGYVVARWYLGVFVCAVGVGERRVGMCVGGRVCAWRGD